MNKFLCHSYSNEVTGKRILLIGPYPPPLGGVSIHIKRVVQKLEKQNNHVVIHNTAHKYRSKLSAFTSLIKKLFSTRPNIIYYHEPTESIQKLFVTVLCKYFLRYKLTTIDHDCRILYNFSHLKKSFFRKIISRVDHVVVIGNTTNACYCDNGIKKIKSCSIESPFLPPDLSQEQAILQEFPQSVHEFIKNHSPLISANAFAPTQVNNKDLYGFDLCIELVQKLKETHPQVGLIFGICKIETNKQKNYFEQIKKTIAEHGLVDHFYFFTNKPEFWPLIKQSDLFVRPTQSDSFGISVQEAISLGTPAIASDVCVRPENTILFKTGSVKDFLEKVETVL